MTRRPDTTDAQRLTRAVEAWEKGQMDFDDFRTEILEVAERVEQAAQGYEAMTSFKFLPFKHDENALFILDAAAEFVESCWDILDGDPREGLKLAQQALDVLEGF